MTWILHGALGALMIVGVLFVVGFILAVLDILSQGNGQQEELDAEFNKRLDREKLAGPHSIRPGNKDK